MPQWRKSDPFIPKSLTEAAKLAQWRRTQARKSAMRPGRPTTAPVDTRLKTAALVWTDGETMTPMVKGNGWEKYKARVIEKGGLEEDIDEGTDSNGYSTIAFNRTALQPFLDSFDLTFVGTAAPQSFPHGRYFLNFESISQEGGTGALAPVLDGIALNHLLTHNLDNVYGCRYIDQREDLPSPARCGAQAIGKKPHTWLVDTTAEGYAAEWIRAAKTLTAGQAPPIIDNVLHQPYPGAATNFAAGRVDESAYRDKMTEVVGGVGAWANAALGERAYTWREVPMRYGEHTLHANQLGTNVGPISQDLASLLPPVGAKAILGFEILSKAIVWRLGSMGRSHVDRFGRDEAGPAGFTWSDIRAMVARLKATERVWILAGRSGSFPLFTNGNLRWMG